MSWRNLVSTGFRQLYLIESGGEDGMLFWTNYDIWKAIPALHKWKKIDVDKGYIKKTVSHMFKKAFCRHSLQGSMTVEAALVIPMVFFVWIACVSWSSIVYVHETVQKELGNTAMELSIAAGENSSRIQNIGGLYAWGQMFQFDEFSAGGVDDVYGFDFSESQIMDGQDGIWLKVNYRVKILEGMIPIPVVRLSNQVYTKAWTGGNPLKDSTSFSLEQQSLVYVAEHGHVYHVDPMCSHIHLTIHMVGKSQTKGYSPCEKCMQDGKEYGQTFYITETGEHYHSRLGCSGLKRQVSQVYLTDMGTIGYEACSRCGGE